MPSELVSLNQVGKNYGHRSALTNLSFQLQRGELAYITGLSGAGKTTLLKLLYLMEKPTCGSIRVRNWDLSRVSRRKVSEYRREVGFVFQDFKLLPDLTVYENVRLPLDFRRMNQTQVRARVEGVLALVGLRSRLDDDTTTLSGGEQQRVAIARSIVSRPCLLLADEPTGNLDTQNSKGVMSLFQEICQMGTTVLIATHDEYLMQLFPARTIELEKGMMVADREGALHAKTASGHSAHCE